MTPVNNDRLKTLVNSFKTKRVAVIGDLILDVYLWGDASRISQEAPVPVMQVNNKTERLGGAANVMCNIVTLGSKAMAYGVTGEDGNGDKLKQLLEDFSIAADGVLQDKKRRTTEKQRVIAGAQQLVRIDHEDLFDVDVSLRQKITERLIQGIHNKEIDGLIFEDYAKGMLNSEMTSKINEAALEAGIMVGLDPHPGHPLNISNISVMTPNKAEAYGLAGIYHHSTNNSEEDDNELAMVAEKIQEKWDPEYLLITLGAKGMALFEKGKKSVIIPTRAREVFDVSGAGDTVIAAFCLSLLAGASGLEAAEIANHAAGIVVGKVGTVSVTAEELLASF